MQYWLIHKLGGYTEDDILTEVVKDLYNAVDENDILRKEGHAYFVGNRQLMQIEIDSLRQDTKTILNSKMWKLLDLDIKYLTNQKMKQATTLFKLESAKMLEYIWDVLKSRLSKL